MTIELIKATGTCQMTPNDSFALRDVSESGRSVGEKVIFFSILFPSSESYFELNNTLRIDDAVLVSVSLFSSLPIKDIA